MLNQRELLFIQKFEKRSKNEKEYLEEIIYNCNIKDFSLQRNGTFLSNICSEMNIQQSIPINP